MTDTKEITPARMYSGDEANKLVRELVVRRQQKYSSGDAVKTGIPFVDSNNPALTRGDVSVIVGLTSEGKSMLATTVIENTIREIETGKRGKTGAVIVALTEETVETRRIQLWGDSRVSIKSVLNGTVPLELVDENIYKATGQPLYFIGDCYGGVDVTEDETYGALTVQRIAASIQRLVAANIAPELVVIDHVHDLTVERDIADEREVSELVARQLVRFSSWLRQYCPLVLVAQAKKEVMQRNAKDRQPTKYDLSYMAAVARRARDMYSIWYPASHLAPDEIVKTSRGSYPAAQGVFVVSMVKARYGEALNKSFAMTATGQDGKWAHRLTELPAK